jgi:hypothetical protein
MRRFTTQMVNPVTRLFAGWLPGLGILTHAGRTTGPLERDFDLNYLRVR